MDKSQKDFEDWIEAERTKLFLDLLDTYPPRYSDPATERLWQAWQASRQAIEIDLSDCFSPYDCGDEAAWIDQLKKQLSVKGIKTTED